MYVPVRKCETFSLNPTRRGLWNGHQVGGGLLKPPLIKTPLEALLTRFFA